MVNDFDAFGLHQLLQLFHNIFRCLFKNSQNTVEVHILASKVICFQQRGELIGELHYKVALVTLGTVYSVLLLRCSLQAVKKWGALAQLAECWELTTHFIHTSAKIAVWSLVTGTLAGANSAETAANPETISLSNFGLAHRSSIFFQFNGGFVLQISFVGLCQNVSILKKSAHSKNPICRAILFNIIIHHIGQLLLEFSDLLFFPDLNLNRCWFGVLPGSGLLAAPGRR